VVDQGLDCRLPGVGGRAHDGARCGRRRARAGGERGFTVIELIVTVVIIGLVTAAVATGIDRIRPASAQAEAGKIAVAVRYLYNLAVVSGHNQRLVIDLDARAWWGEEQLTDDPCEAFLLPEKGADDADGAQAKGGPGKDGERPAPTGGFEASKSTLLQKTELDKGITFSGVMTSHQQQPTEKGVAYVYFFPNGTTEHAYIQVQGGEDDFTTVEVVALQGSARVHNQNLDLKELARELGREVK